MSKQFASRCFSAALVLLLGSCLGCGTGEYEERLKAAETQLRQGSKTAQMQRANIPGTPLRFRLPPNLPGTPLAEGTDPRRLQPATSQGVNLLPGLKATYESFQPYEGGKMAFYCYLAATETSSLGGRDPRSSLQLQLRKLYPDSPGEWQQVHCPTPDGLTETWGKLRVVGDQDFWDLDAAGNGTFKRTGGVLEFFVRQVGNHFVVVAWRVPTAYEGNIKLAEWAPWVAGSVTAKP